MTIPRLAVDRAQVIREFSSFTYGENAVVPRVPDEDWHKAALMIDREQAPDQGN